MKITISGATATIETPYNANFVERIRKVGSARWSSESRAWQVPAVAVEAVRQIMRDVYGEDDSPATGEKLVVRLTFADKYGAGRKDVTILGKCLSRATGRDSGATVGEGVAYISGAPMSGGSVKNWRSCVSAGAVVMLYNVPKTLYDGYALPEGVTAEVVGAQSPDEAALKKEKELLLARLAEIDALLDK